MKRFFAWTESKTALRNPTRVMSCVLALSVLVSLGGCKQDSIMHDAAGFKDLESRYDTLSADIKAQPLQSCQRIAVLGQLQHKVTRADFTFPTPAPAAAMAAAAASACAANGRVSKLLGEQLDVLTTYLKALERAGTGQTVDLKAGAFLTGLKTNGVIGSSPDAANVDKIANAVVQLIANHERALFVKQSVLDANDAVQGLAKNIAQSFDDKECAIGKQTYCSLFYNELLEACTSYAFIFETVHGASRKATSCESDPTYVPTTVSASLSDVLADNSLRQQYLAARAVVAGKIEDGKRFADVVSAIAKAHQDLHDYILRAPDASTALFDR